MKRGFTLTEILVVIVVIAVLLAITFPVYTGATSKAKETGCVSNLHQLYVGMQLYHDDYGDFPPTGNDNILNDRYLGGVKLHCQVQNSKWLASDYHLNGSPPIGAPTSRDRLALEWKECRDKRGSDFPLVWDSNHASPLVAYQAGQAFFLIARESGQIQRVGEELQGAIATGQKKAPCALDLSLSNL